MMPPSRRIEKGSTAFLFADLIKSSRCALFQTFSFVLQMPSHGFCDGWRLHFASVVLGKTKPLNMTCVLPSVNSWFQLLSGHEFFVLYSGIIIARDSVL